MITLVTPPSLNERALGQVYLEQQTGITGTTITLSYSVAQTADGVSLVLLFKNGTLLAQGGSANQYSVTGKIITLVTAAVNTDLYVAYYHYRN